MNRPDNPIPMESLMPRLRALRAAGWRPADPTARPADVNTYTGKVAP